MTSVDSFMKEFKEKMEKFDQDVKYARGQTRDAIFKMVTLSTAIVGLSVSLFSIPQLQQSFDLIKLQKSWLLFVLTIITGILSFWLEGRILYGKTWKATQSSLYPPADQPDYTCKECFIAWLITIYTLFYPTNMALNRARNISEERQKERARINGLVVHRLARTSWLLNVFEIFLLAFFALALIYLVLSFKSASI